MKRGRSDLLKGRGEGLEGEVCRIKVGEGEWILREGEQWVVTGPMASGKTTLALRLVEALGEEAALVTFGGQGVASGSDWAAARYHGSIAYDFRTVDEVLGYDQVHGINPFEVRPREVRARAAFKRLRGWCEEVLELRGLLDRWTVQLSNGEQRRVMLACAILRGGRVLILDDPFAGLDVRQQGRVREVLEALVSQGRQLVVMVRHEDEIPRCMTHWLRLREHRVVGQGRLRLPLAEAPGMVFGKNPPSLGTPEVISVRNLSLPIEGRELFGGLTWEVHEGERWLVVGPNGSGKTTLLALISGECPFGYGCDIRRFGKRVGPGVPLWSIRSRMAMVSPEEQACVDGRVTVEEMIYSGCFDEEGRRVKPTATQCREAMALVKALDLQDRLQARMGELSAGLARLVLVVRALVPQPSLLLLDELCMNLEPKVAKRVLQLLGRLFVSRPSLTVICIAHRADQVPPNFERVLQL